MKKCPTIIELSSLIKGIKEDLRQYSERETDLTIGWTPGKGWGYQTGDNSYTGGAYFHPLWGVDTVTRGCNSRELAKEIINQLMDQYYSDPHWSKEG